ncbi:MAG: hypothetical protein U1E76_25495 [Planctomycetota bacterium]
MTCVASLVWLTLLGDPLSARPWAAFTPVEKQLAELRASAADDATKLAQAARWCAGKGLFREMEELLGQALKREPANPTARALFGSTQGTDGAWHLDEYARYSALPAKAPALLAPPSASDRARLLAQKDRELHMASSSTYFDLWSDLESEPLRRYTEQLNGYYRSLKNTFQAYAGGNIDVLVFATRSDYLRYYQRMLGKGGEHVLGFYAPASRLLVFYHDPYDLDMVLNTARHECTHLLLDLGYDGAPLPMWLNEGMACFLAADTSAADSYVADLIMTVVDQIRANDVLPLAKLLDLDQEHFGFAHYAQSWSWMQFLNQPQHSAAFQRYLDKLRKALPQAPDAPDKVAAYRQSCLAKANGLFLREIAPDLAGIEAEWRRYFTDQFALTNPRRLADFGWSCCGMAQSARKQDERSERLELAQASFALAPASDARLSSECTQGDLACLLLRASEREQTTGAQRLFLRTALERIATLPDDDENVWLQGRLAGRTLVTFRKMADQGAPHSSRSTCARPCSMPTTRIRRRDAPGDPGAVRRNCSRPRSSRSRARPTKEPAACDRGARLAVVRAQAGAGTHRAVFPNLRLLVEKDPDDRNLAALGLAYLGLGDPAFGRMLFEEGKQRSVSPGGLAAFAEFFD